jgi:hypothetical protein
MPKILTITNTVTKAFLKATSNRTKGFLEAAVVGISLLYSFQQLSETSAENV